MTPTPFYPFFAQVGNGAGSGPGQFNSPIGIALDTSGNIYVADAGNNRVQKFDPTGNYLLQWGTPGTGNGQFNRPMYLAVNSAGTSIYVGDSNNYRVQVFDSDGNYLTQWGVQGSGDGQFSYVGGIAVAPSQNVYVGDMSGRIQEFDSGGNFILKWQVGIGSWIREVTVSSSGNVFVASQSSPPGIFVYSPSGTLINSWSTFLYNTTNMTMQPLGIAVDASMNVFVTSGPGSFIKFDTTGTTIDQRNSYSWPYGIAVDTSDHVYITSGGPPPVAVLAPY